MKLEKSIVEGIGQNSTGNSKEMPANSLAD